MEENRRDSWVAASRTSTDLTYALLYRIIDRCRWRLIGNDGSAGDGERSGVLRPRYASVVPVEENHHVESSGKPRIPQQFFLEQACDIGPSTALFSFHRLLVLLA